MNANLLTRVRAWFARTAGQALRSLPIVRDLWAEIEGPIDGASASRRNEVLDLWLGGMSIAQAAAYANPGAHGAVIVVQQRVVEDAARAYILKIEAERDELRESVTSAVQTATNRAHQLDVQIVKLQAENERLKAQIIKMAGAQAKSGAALAKGGAA